MSGGRYSVRFVPDTPVLMVGYGLREVDELIELLRLHRVEYLGDVRSVPFSRHRPAFSKEPLERALRDANIRYVFLGDTLGGRPADPSCYDEEGHVDYAQCRMSPVFETGIERVSSAAAHGHRLVLMCSEARPTDCHRTKLLAEMLVERGVHVQHLDEHGELVEHAEIAARLRGPQLSLIADGLGRSRRPYRAA
jgi:uncharacterized protein (DUF488 family)